MSRRRILEALRSSVAMLGWSVAGVLSAYAAAAATVTVVVTTKSGAPAEDAVIVFDPLDAAPAPAQGAATIDQVNKRFVPRVSVIRTGTAVEFPNSDAIRHQVYSFSPTHRFTLKLYGGSPRVEVKFDKPGLVVLGCNIHDTMVGFVAVVDSPYFAKTSRSGSVALTLPPGRYRLRMWHPNLTAVLAPEETTVGDGPLMIPLTVDMDMSHTTALNLPE